MSELTWIIVCAVCFVVGAFLGLVTMSLLTINKIKEMEINYDRKENK